MTRKQTVTALREVNTWLDKQPGPWGIGHPDLGKAHRYIWYKKHYEVCLAAGVDPESLWHYAGIARGEGRKWKKSLKKETVNGRLP